MNKAQLRDAACIKENDTSKLDKISQWYWNH